MPQSNKLAGSGTTPTCAPLPAMSRKAIGGKLTVLPVSPHARKLSKIVGSMSLEAHCNLLPRGNALVRASSSRAKLPRYRADHPMSKSSHYRHNSYPGRRRLY